MQSHSSHTRLYWNLKNGTEMMFGYVTDHYHPDKQPYCIRGNGGSLGECWEVSRVPTHALYKQFRHLDFARELVVHAFRRSRTRDIGDFNIQECGSKLGLQPQEGRGGELVVAVP
jgi:hypothetical protein